VEAINMRVLVGFTSRHGATAEIAARIGDVLREVVTDADPTCVVEVRGLVDMGDMSCYDAAVIGSAVYLGRWSAAARMFVRHNAAELRTRPVWFFSSGPVAGVPPAAEDSSEVRALAALVGARGHRLFPGRLRLSELGFTERMAVRAAHAEDGDFRDWYDVAQWAVDVADDLLASSLVPDPVTGVPV
jgi:menaquinone-dependent protoporphyrinogen oxidase